MYRLINSLSVGKCTKSAGDQILFSLTVGVPFVLVGKGSVEINSDCIICGSVGAVCKLEWV